MEKLGEAPKKEQPQKRHSVKSPGPQTKNRDIKRDRPRRSYSKNTSSQQDFNREFRQFKKEVYKKLDLILNLLEKGR